MPKDHVGLLSEVTYTIPELTDVRDVEVAFGDFADTLPPTPPVMIVETITANKNPAEPNHLYIYAGTTPITVTLPAGGDPNDRIAVAQLTAGGIITVAGVGAGVPVTTGANSAVSAVWDSAKWVGLPFSFSGTRPAESSGGVISTPGDGFRYHTFATPGTYTFTSHKALTVDAYIAGAGSSGGLAGASPGVAGGGGEIVALTAEPIGDWTFTTIVVGAPGTAGAAGGASGLGDTPAAGGTVGGTTPPTAIPPGWPVIGGTPIGGPGTADAGPTAATVKAKGGGGEHKLLTPYTPGTETYDCSVGGSYSYDCSYGARAEDYQCGSHVHQGDAAQCVSGGQNCGGGCYVWGTNCTASQGQSAQCPGGWYLCGANCCTNIPDYCRNWHCDNGGNSNGSGTCVKTCSGSNYEQRTCTRTAACTAGYVNSGGLCVDARAAGAGPGGGGIVSLRYVYP